MKLETPRILLRPFAADDLGALCNLTANIDFMRFSFGPKTRAETQEVLEKFLAWNRADEPSQFALIDRQTTRLFGFCGFLHQEVDGAKEIEIGYRLHPDFWDKGLATEAAEPCATTRFAISSWRALFRSFTSTITLRNASPRRTA